nr:FAD-dependent oxidoreductase [Planctomycetota bacterium]
MHLLSAYANWLHLRWPAGRVERLPVVDEAGGCSVAGVSIAGDLAGVPLLKFSLDTGAKAAQRAAEAILAMPPGEGATIDVAIIGGGVAGMAAAAECARRKLRFTVIEAGEPFTTIANFPVAKPIFTYPKAMTPAGVLQVGATVKEALLEELRAQIAPLDIPVTHATATHVERRNGALAVMLADGAPILARRVIVAIGRSGNFRRLGVTGE